MKQRLIFEMIECSFDPDNDGTDCDMCDHLDDCREVMEALISHYPMRKFADEPIDCYKCGKFFQLSKAVWLSPKGTTPKGRKKWGWKPNDVRDEQPFCPRCMEKLEMLTKDTAIFS